MAQTAAQIVTLACQIAKAPGYVAQAGQLLNTILQELAENNDFDLLRLTTTINVSSTFAYYTLPADYLRFREVFYSVNGTIFYLNQIPLEDYDQLFQGPGINNYPQSFATDMSQSPPRMYFWPPPAISLAVTVRYQSLPADITTPETSSSVPWFPVQLYLVKRLAANLMMLTDDSRQNGFEAEAEQLLKKYLITKDDKEGYAQSVKLDRRVFRPTSNLPPSKLFGY